MASSGLICPRWSGRGLALLVALAACGPSAVAKRTVHVGGDVDAEVQGGSGGEGGTSGTGGAIQPDASGGGGTGGNAPPDAAPDLAADAELPADVPADVADDGPSDGGKDGPGTGKTVLVVMGFVPPTDPAFKPGDVKLRARLEGRGFTVKIGDDDDPDASKAMGADLVIITDSNGAKVGTKYNALKIPVICMKNTLFDDLKMTAGTTTEGTTNTAQVAITMAASPLAGGLTGTVTVVGANTAATWANPAGAAQKVATIQGQTTQWAVFGYAAGAMMSGTTAAGKRVGLFITDAMADAMNESGWKLFDAAVDWTLQ